MYNKTTLFIFNYVTTLVNSDGDISILNVLLVEGCVFGSLPDYIFIKVYLLLDAQPQVLCQMHTAEAEVTNKKNDISLLNTGISVSYTHLTLPTICSV